MKLLLKPGQVQILLVGVLACLVITVLLAMSQLPHRSLECPQCHCANPPNSKQSNSAANEAHKLCILVPFRDRFEELLEFAPHITSYLNQKNIDHDIWVLNQVDGYRFNRASLINVGFRESPPGCDYIAMHDVDLLPLSQDLSYSFPAQGPFHVASPDLHPKYNYPTFIGGILLVTRKHFSQVNGMSNRYWGWGLEDDEFFVRLRQANLMVERPVGVTSGRGATFKHIHSKKVRKRDMAKCHNQQNMTRRVDRVTGVNNVDYTVERRTRLVVEGAAVNLLNVALNCDKELTPWCNCTGVPNDKGKQDRTRDENVVVPLLPRSRVG